MELQDKKKTRFSNLVSKEMGHLEWNEGKIGGGNDYIQRTVQNAIIGRKRYWSTTLANVGVKIPPGIGQLNVRAVKTNFITKNMIKYPSYNSHLSPSVSTKLKQKISKTYQA